jgi:acyl-CoA oxidase
VARLVPDTVRGLVHQVGPQAVVLVGAFGLPDHLVAAPIAANWEAYNAVDNQGELVGSAFAAA